MAEVALLVARAQAAWPEVHMTEGAFAAHLASCLSPAGAGIGLDGLHIEDLYLARACLEGAPQSTETFAGRYRPVITKYLARLSGPSDMVEETTQVAFTRLLVGTPARPPQLAGYRGRSALAHFVGITAQRLALNDGRAGRARGRLAKRLAAEPRFLPKPPERSLVSRRYRKRIEAALHKALSNLTSHDRVIMRLHFVGGLSTVRIATMYRVDHSTVSRWLARCRRRIWEEVQQDLRIDLNLSSGEIESLLASVASSLDLRWSDAF